MWDFWGELVISGEKNARNYEKFWIDSERTKGGNLWVIVEK
jgi:hypothetical protein